MKRFSKHLSRFVLLLIVVMPPLRASAYTFHTIEYHGVYYNACLEIHQAYATDYNKYCTEADIPYTLINNEGWYFVTRIVGNAFSGWTNLNKVIIPSSVDEIGDYAFKGCTSLTAIFCQRPDPLTINPNVFSNYNANLYVPSASVSKYKAKDPWKRFNVLSDEGTATGITLNKSSLTIKIGDTEKLLATVTPSDAINKTVSWSSSKPGVATVDQDGNVTAKTFGDAIITATTTDGSNLSATCQVYVRTKVLATGISLNKTSTSLKVGSAKTLVATVSPSNATNKTVLWRSSDSSVAFVGQDGQVVAKAPGTANITATTTDGTNLSATCNVTVTLSGGAGSCPSVLALSALESEQPADNVGVELMLVNSSLNLNGFNIEVERALGNGNIRFKNFTASNYANVILQQWEGTTWIENEDGDMVEMEITDDVRKQKLSEMCDIKYNEKTRSDGNKVFVILEVLSSNDCRFFPVLNTLTGVGKFYLDMSSCGDGVYRIYAPATPTGCSFSYTGGPEGTRSWTADAPVSLSLFKNGNTVIASVLSSVLASGISLNKTSTSLKLGRTETLVATVTPGNVTNNSVSWKSSNTSIATVDQNGKVTAKAVGTANVTATTTDGTNLSATCKVTVTPASPQDPCPSALMFSALKESQSSSNIAVELMLVNSSLNLNGFNIEVERASGSESIRFKNFTASNYANVILQRWEGTTWIENEDGDMVEVEITDAVRKQKLSEMCDIKYNEKTRSDGKKVFVILEVLSSNDCRFFPALDAPAAVGRMNLDMSSCADGTYKIVAPATPAGCSFSYTGGPEGTRGWTADAPVEFSLMKVGDNVYAPVLGICTVDVDRNLVTTKYYNLQGIESDIPFPGINIVVMTYSDGTTTSKKILCKQ